MLALTFQIGQDRFALDIRAIREVVPHVPLQSVSGAPPWLAGLLIYRAGVAPVVDLHRLLGAGACPDSLSTRIILTPRSAEQPHSLFGLLAAQVTDLREVAFEDAPACRQPARGGRIMLDHQEIIRLVDVPTLLPPEVHLYLNQEYPE